MEKDLVIQKLVKIAKTQQILLKKLANIDEENDLPSNYDEIKNIFIKKMTRGFENFVELRRDKIWKSYY